MLNAVRAKFTCTSITKSTKYPSGFMWAYKFNVVTSGSEENKEFFASTPSGNIEIAGIRDDLFEVGQEYYLDFTPAQA